MTQKVKIGHMQGEIESSRRLRSLGCSQYRSPVFSFTTAVIKYPNNSSLRKEGFQLRVQGPVHHGGHAEAAGAGRCFVMVFGD